MSAPVYATVEQVRQWIEPEDLPASITTRALRDASRQVDEMLVSAVYAVDENDLPTDPRISAAIREATISQALHRATYGDESEIRENSVPVKLGSLSIGGSSDSAGVSVWAPAALGALRVEGLIPGGTQ